MVIGLLVIKLCARHSFELMVSSDGSLQLYPLIFLRYNPAPSLSLSLSLVLIPVSLAVWILIGASGLLRHMFPSDTKRMHTVRGFSNV